MEATRRRAILFACLAALGLGRCTCEPAAPAEVPCNSNADCPAELVCRAGLCAAPGAYDAALLDAALLDASPIDATLPDATPQDAALPDVTLADIAQPDATPQDTALPDVILADTARPDATPQDAALPDVILADTARPDATAQDAALPDVTRPADASLADATQPDATAQDAALPDVTHADATIPTDANRADVGHVDTSLPDAAQVDAVVQDVALADASFADATRPPDANFVDASLGDAAAPVPWLQPFNLRYRLQVLNENGDEVVTDFPVLVVLTPARFDYAAVPDPGLIRFTAADGVTVLAHELERWDAAGRSFFWVKLPAIARKATTFFWLYAATMAAGELPLVPAGVWSNGFEAVYHLDGNGQSSVAGIPDGTPASATTVDGQVGQALYFNGAGATVALGSNLPLLTLASGWTLSAWCRPAASGAPQMVIALAVGGGQPSMMSRAELAASRTNIQSTARASDTEGSQVLSQPANLSAADWHLLAATTNYATGTMKVFGDGAQLGSRVVSFTALHTPATGVQVGAIGSQDDGTAPYFLGDIDEVRVARVVRNGAWLKLEYQSGRDTLLSYGGVEVR